jgi:gamma-glutamylcyclotransferase (GGCT)/AIG2-like uncharacterized protein YtfP
MLLEHGVYTNPIIYPAVARKDARIRMSVTATHDKEHLDKTLNAFEDINKKLHIAKINNKCQEKLYRSYTGQRKNKTKIACCCWKNLNQRVLRIESE